MLVAASHIRVSLEVMMRTLRPLKRNLTQA